MIEHDRIVDIIIQRSRAMTKGILQFAHQLLKNTIQEGDTIIDATCGNGHDTVFLSKLAGKSGHVFGFDIQTEAITHTAKRLQEQSPHKNTILIQDSHSNFLHHIPVDKLTRLGGAIFNLGYLPGGDKQLITKSDSTITAIEGIMTHLQPKGIIVLVIYHGHKGGKEEMQAIMKYARLLDQKQFAALYYGYINQKHNPPFILAIEKK